MLCVNLPAHLSNYFKAINFKQYDILAGGSGRNIIDCWWFPGLFWGSRTTICIYKPFGPTPAKHLSRSFTWHTSRTFHLLEVKQVFKDVAESILKKKLKRPQWNLNKLLIEFIRPTRWSFFKNTKTHQTMFFKTIFTLMSIFHCMEVDKNLCG